MSLITDTGGQQRDAVNYDHLMLHGTRHGCDDIDEVETALQQAIDEGRVEESDGWYRIAE